MDPMRWRRKKRRIIMSRGRGEKIGDGGRPHEMGQTSSQRKAKADGVLDLVLESRAAPDTLLSVTSSAVNRLATTKAPTATMLQGRAK